MDVLTNEDAPHTDSPMDKESLCSELDNILSAVLKDREKKVIVMSFGIGCHEKSLEEIGDLLGLTRERVRQIKEKSLRKIKNDPGSKILLKYLG